MNAQISTATEFFFSHSWQDATKTRISSKTFFLLRRHSP